jgi:5-formyltetrahydrofolate cyclo-ligase
VSLDDRKRQLREQLRECSASSEDAEAVRARLFAIPELRAATSLALFASLADEVAMRPVFERATKQGKRCLLPRTTNGGLLEFFVVPDWEDLRPGRYGVPEPSGKAGALPLAEAEVVLVPGVAFDRTGGRLGRGGGHYDRALAGVDRSRCLVIGVTTNSRLVDELPRAVHDQPVDVVVTERDVLRGWSR